MTYLDGIRTRIPDTTPAEAALTVVSLPFVAAGWLLGMLWAVALWVYASGRYGFDRARS